MTNRKNSMVQGGYEQERPQWGILWDDWCYCDASRCEIPEEHRELWETYADKVKSEQTTEWEKQDEL